MKIDTTPINETRIKITVTFDPQETQKVEQEIVAEVVRHANIKGFRPGKAPVDLVKRQHDKTIGEEIKHRIISQGYTELEKEAKSKIVAIVKIDGPQVESNKSTGVVFTVDTLPEIALPEYKGLEFKAASEEVSAEEVQSALAGIRKTRAQYNKVERTAQKGDYAKVAYEGVLDGKLLQEIVEDLSPVWGKQTGAWEEAGCEKNDYSIHEISEALPGMKVGDKKEVTVAFPKDFSAAALAGKKAIYTVELKEVREVVLPTPESLISDFKVNSLQELEESLRRDIETRKREQNLREQRNQVAKFLLDHVPNVSLPQSLLEMETADIMRSMVEQAMRRGSKQSDIEARKQEYFENAKKAAQENVKLSIILEQIAAKESIKLDENDISHAVVDESYALQMRPEQLVKELQKDSSRLQRLKQRALCRKAIDFLVKASKNIQAA